MTRLALALALALLFPAGCHQSAPTTTPATEAPVTLPDGGTRHTERLVVSAWKGGAFAFCEPVTNDLATALRLAQARCHVVDGPGAAPKDARWPDDASFVRDTHPVEWAPGRCRVLYQDVDGNLGDTVARASLLGPQASQRTPLAEWQTKGVAADYFTVEASFSPDGRWLALLEAAVGIGDGDRTVEVKSVEVRPAPACR